MDGPHRTKSTAKPKTQKKVIAAHVNNLHRASEPTTQKERLYRYLFFLSFTFNILWIIGSIIFAFWLFSPKADGFLVNNGIKRYCDPNGSMSRYYQSLDTNGHGQNLWERICFGPNTSSSDTQP